MLDPDPFALILRTIEPSTAPPKLDASRVTYILDINPIPKIDVDLYLKFRAEEKENVIPVLSLYKSGFHYPFVPRLFENIRLSDFPANERPCLVDYILCGFIAWACYYDKTGDPQYFPVVTSVLFSVLELAWNSATLSAFCFASKLFLQRSDTVVGAEYMAHIVTLFSQTSAVLPVGVCFLLVELVRKLIEAGDSSAVTQVTVLICRTAEENRRLLSAEYVDAIVEAMRPLLLGFSPQALACLSYIFPITDPKKHLELFGGLARSMMKLVEEKNQPLLWPKSKEAPVLVCPVLGKEVNVALLMEKESFRGGFNLGKNPFENRNILNLTVDPVILDVVRLIRLSMTTTDCAVYFLNEVFRMIRDNLESPYLGNYFHFFILSHRECLGTLPNLEASVSVFESGVFAANITVFDNPEDFEVMDALRNLALQNVLTEGPEMLVRVIELSLPYPKLFAELCYRFAAMGKSFFDVIRASRGVVDSICSVMKGYAALQATSEDDLIEHIENARKALLFLLKNHLLADLNIRLKFFKNMKFCMTYIEMLMERNLREFILDSFYEFSQTTEQEQMKGMVAVLSRKLIEASRYMECPDMRDLIVRVLEVCTEVETDNVAITFPSFNKIICEMLYRAKGMDSESGRVMIEKSIDFMTAAGDRLLMTAEDAAMLTNSIKNFYDSEKLGSIFDKLVGMVMTNVDGTCVIKHGHLLSILFDVFSESHLFISIFELLCEVCTAHQGNIRVCHEAEVDLLLIEMAWKLAGEQETEKVKTVLHLLEIVATVISSPSVVNRFFSLLSEIGPGTISNYAPMFAETLYRIIASDYHNQGRTVQVSPDCSTPLVFEVLDALKAGFALSFWIYLHRKVPEIVQVCGLMINSCPVWVKLKGARVVLDIGDKVFETELELAVDRWCFVNIAVQGSAVVYCCDLLSEQMITLDGTPFGDITKITILKPETPISHFNLELGFGGLSDMSNTGAVTRAYLSSPENGPVDRRGFFVDFLAGIWTHSEKCQPADTRSFGFCLSKLLRLDLLIPMFGLYSLKLENGALWTDSITTTMAILAKAIKCPDDKTEDIFVDACHVEAICGILSYCPSGVLTYNTYLSIYFFFQNLKSTELRKQVFRILLINPSLWVSVPAGDQEKIFTHWAKVLFASDIRDCMGDKPFHQMLVLLLTSYASPDSESDKDLESRSMRLNSIHAILLATAKRSFTLQDFHLLCEWSMAESQRPFISEMLVFLLKAIVHDVESLKDMSFTPKDAALLTMLFNQRNEQIIADVIDIVIHLHRTGILDAKLLSCHLVLILKALNIQILGETFFRAVLNAMEIGNPELLPICCWYAVNKGEKAQEAVASALSSLDKTETSRLPLWYIWPAILAIRTTGDSQLLVLDFLYKCDRDNWVQPFCALRIVAEALNANWKEIQNTFLVRICEQIQSNPNAQEDAMKQFYSVATWYLFMKPYCLNDVLERLYRESAYAVDGSFEEPGQVESEPLVDAGKIYDRLMDVSRKKPSNWTFGLELSESGEWKREPLGRSLLQLARAHHGLFPVQSIVMISHFVSYTSHDFVFEALNDLSEDIKEVKNFAYLVVNKQEKARRNQLITYMEQGFDALKQSHSSAYSDVRNTMNKYLSEMNDTIVRLFVADASVLNREPIPEAPITYKCRCTWKSLWAQLSVENGPWYPKSALGSTSVTYRRDRSACGRFLCPFKMCRTYPTDDSRRQSGTTVAELVFDNLFSNTRTTKVGSPSEKATISHECQLIRLLSEEEHTFRLFKKEIVLCRHSDGRETRISNDQITLVCLRGRSQKLTGLELFLDDGSSFLLNFIGGLKIDAASIAGKIAANCSNKAKLVQQQSFAAFFASSGVQSEWIEGKISNFEYLMKLNLFSGRSFSDLTQYPFFPWILSDYESARLDLENPEIFRPLDKPLLSDPAETENQFTISPYAVCSYLVRLEPFTTEQTKLHGDSHFHCISEMYRLVTEDVTQSWELIPEFFFMPEFLTNQKHTNSDVDDVKLPKWSRGVPINFIYLHRKALESDYVSSHLSDWIDLVWGCKQKVSKTSSQCPPQLFTVAHPQRKKRSKPIVHQCWRALSLTPEFVCVSMHEMQKQLHVSLLGANGELWFVRIDINNIEGSGAPKVVHRFPASTENTMASQYLNSSRSLVFAQKNEISVVTNGRPLSLQFENTITSIASAGRWVSVTCDDNVSRVIDTSRINDIRTSFKCYRDSITCSFISNDFHIHVAGTRDGALVLTSLKTGKTTHVIELGNAVPTRVLVTPSWGFIVVDVKQKIQGFVKHFLDLYTINGDFIRKTELEATSIIQWTTWSSHCGFDYIAFITDNLVVFTMEAFYMTPRRLSSSLIRRPIGIFYSEKLSALLTVENDGRLSVIDTCLDDFAHINIAD